MKFDTYYNGKYGTRNSIKIPLTDRAVFFGDGIYDACIGKNRMIFMLKEHVDRFFSNKEALSIPLSLTKQELEETLREMAKNTDRGCFFLYFQLSRFSEKRVHAYPDEKSSNLLITVDKIDEPNPDKLIKLTEFEDIRYKMCNIKTINLLPAVLASKKAEICGADESVFHRGDTVTECAHSNIHIIKNGILFTHPKNNLILPGITREHLLLCCKKLNIEFREEPFTLKQLEEADEVLVTSSSKLCRKAESFEDIHYDTAKHRMGKALCEMMYEDFVRWCK